MKQLWFPLVSCLILGSLPLDAVHAQQRSIVRVALPGSIEPVILSHIGPAFTAAKGYSPELTRSQSFALVNPVGGAEPRPHVDISSDVNQKKLLCGPRRG